jgi:hypothetical protein
MHVNGLIITRGVQFWERLCEEWAEQFKLKASMANST